MLARLYLEDRKAPERVEELLDKVARNTEQPGWEDRYLEALVARNDGNGRVDEMVAALEQALQAGDPRHVWLERHQVCGLGAPTRASIPFWWRASRASHRSRNAAWTAFGKSLRQRGRVVAPTVGTAHRRPQPTR